MRLFLTGGSGFLGAHFLASALRAGHTVRALRRSGGPGAADGGLEWVSGDLETVADESLPGCDALVHFAACGVSPQQATWEELFRWNVSASVRLWHRAADAGVRRFVLCGSCLEYGRSAARFERIPPSAPLEPLTGYAASKAAASVAAIAFAAERGVELVLLRPFNVYGEGQHPSNLVPSLRRAAAAGGDFDLTPGEQVRDFQAVEACAEDFVRALTEPARYGEAVVRNTGSGVPRTLRSFAEEQWRLAGAKGTLRIGALPYRRNELMRLVPELPDAPG